MYAGVDSGGSVPEGSERLVAEGLGRFRRVPESSGTCWCRFRRQGSEGVGSRGRVQVPESSGVVCCLATLTGAAM